MSAPMQYYPQPARDDLAFRMFAAWINCDPDKVPAHFRAWTCPQTRQAWERVAAVRADLVPAEPKVKALVEALRWYASQEAWTIDQVEGPHGDYGAKARAAIAALEGGDA